MNIRYKLFRKQPCIEIIYADEEWKVIKERMEKLQLSVKTTTMGFDCNKSYEYYRDIKRNFKNWISSGTPIIDDINSPIIREGKVNISPFRVVPNNKNITRIPIVNGLDIYEFELFVQIMSNVYKMIMSGITEEKMIKMEVIQ